MDVENQCWLVLDTILHTPVISSNALNITQNEKIVTRRTTKSECSISTGHRMFGYRSGWETGNTINLFWPQEKTNFIP